MATFNLDPERAATLNELLDQALERPASERPIWLEQLSGAHQDLKPHLRDLLSRAADVETRDFLGALPHFTPPNETLRIGGRALEPLALVGPYRLMREL